MDSLPETKATMSLCISRRLLVKATKLWKMATRSNLTLNKAPRVYRLQTSQRSELAFLERAPVIFLAGVFSFKGLLTSCLFQKEEIFSWRNDISQAFFSSKNDSPLCRFDRLVQIIKINPVLFHCIDSIAGFSSIIF